MNELMKQSKIINFIVKNYKAENFQRYRTFGKLFLI